MARLSFRVEGLKELDEALKELPRATAKRVLLRALNRAAEPIAAEARRLAPRRSRYLSEHIIVSSKLKNTVGNAEYAAAMSAGLGRAAAGEALREARRGAKGTGSMAEVYVGPTAAAFWGMFQEFGTARHPPKPFMRPAFDSKARAALDMVKAELADEIQKTVARLAKKAARAVAKAKG